MTNESEFDTSYYERYVAAKVSQECLQQDPVYNSVRYVSFISTSNGRNRPPRSPREVSLLKPVNSDSPTFQVVRGTIKSHGSSLYNGPDRLAEEVLEDVPAQDRNPSLLLERAIRNAELEEKNKKILRDLNDLD